MCKNIKYEFTTIIFELYRHLLSGSCRIVRGLVKRANSTAATLKLTKDNGSLTLEQRKFYEDNGYLVIPKLVPNDMLEAYNKRYILYNF